MKKYTMRSCHQSWSDEKELMNRGISMTQSPASLFITILELIMLNHIPDYAMKKELFLDLYRGLCIHKSIPQFPNIA